MTEGHYSIVFLDDAPRASHTTTHNRIRFEKALTRSRRTCCGDEK